MVTEKIERKYGEFSSDRGALKITDGVNEILIPNGYGDLGNGIVEIVDEINELEKENSHFLMNLKLKNFYICNYDCGDTEIYNLISYQKDMKLNGEYDVYLNNEDFKSKISFKKIK